MFTKFALLTLLAAPALGALAPRASGTPSCTYKCPTADKSAWQNVGSSTNGNTLTCYYYPTNQFSDKYYCQYNSQTGAITKDGDGGYCKTTAAQDVCTRKYDRDGVFEAHKQKREARAAAPAATIPEYMSQRASLKKRKMLTRLD